MYETLTNEFDSIMVTSNADFNGRAAGSSLGDVIRLVAFSPYKWLKSGCSITYNWIPIPKDYRTAFPEVESVSTVEDLRHTGDWRLFCPEHYPVNDYLSNLKKDDLLLLNKNDFIILFTETPSVKHHKLTISFFESDRVISNAVEIDFE